jgi:hypothetical protein
VHLKEKGESGLKGRKGRGLELPARVFERANHQRMISNCCLAIRILLQIVCCAHESHETCGRIMGRILVGCAKGVRSSLGQNAPPNILNPRLYTEA